MGDPQDIGYRPVPERYPYQDILQMEGNYVPYEQWTCPICGSRQMTMFNNLICQQYDEKTMSGDLRYKTLAVGRCLSCGREVPMKFRCIREA
ncbi:MAG: hypothetical protein JXA22_05690 [Candidatus Thermoplasmatota archaeon]|nr:hypothetical protein [Candidatus Thermoplasmatota archaeon]